MKTPQFWHKKNLLAYLLLPLSWLYSLGHFLNCWRKIPNKISKPIICIGNLVAGGAGKTPSAIAIGHILKEMGINFAYLSKGYGGKIADFTFVKPHHSAQDVGDEPLLLAQIADSFICKNKLFGAKQIALMPEKKIIIMDDGLQDSSIIKSLNILVIDGNYGLGNGFIIPAGPLREKAKTGIKKADLIILIGEDKTKIVQNLCHKKLIKKLIIPAKIKAINADKFLQKPVIAFCGIGRPQKFFDSLRQEKIQLIKEFIYADHHQFLPKEIEKMIDFAKQNQAQLITTKKDWVRLPVEFQKQIDYLDIEIEFENSSLLRKKLIELI